MNNYKNAAMFDIAAFLFSQSKYLLRRYNCINTIINPNRIFDCIISKNGCK